MTQDHVYYKNNPFDQARLSPYPGRDSNNIREEGGGQNDDFWRSFVKYMEWQRECMAEWTIIATQTYGRLTQVHKGPPHT